VRARARAAGLQQSVGWCVRGLKGAALHPATSTPPTVPRRYPAALAHTHSPRSRAYSDGVDLNRIFPGKRAGTASQQFAHAFMGRLVRHVDYLLDLHTASFGRVNSVSGARPREREGGRPRGRRR
jgi:hypothetical protein